MHMALTEQNMQKLHPKSVSFHMQINFFSQLTPELFFFLLDFFCQKKKKPEQRYATSVYCSLLYYTYCALYVKFSFLYFQKITH